MSDDRYLKPNAKTTVENFEISCYGEGMIMVDHVAFPAPRPIKPTDPDEFWDKPRGERLETVLDYIDSSIAWTELDAETFRVVMRDLEAARERTGVNDA